MVGCAYLGISKGHTTNYAPLGLIEALIDGNGGTPHRNAHGKGGIKLSFELLLKCWCFSSPLPATALRWGVFGSPLLGPPCHSPPVGAFFMHAF